MKIKPVQPVFDIQKWRKEFPLLDTHIHLGNCSQSPQSLRVREAVDGYLNHWNSVGMDWDEWMEAIFRSKLEFARLIGAEASDISMHGSVSQVTYAVASALDYREKRNRVVITEADFPTVVHIWKACRRMGYELVTVPVRDGAIDPDEYERIVNERTLLVCIPAVYYLNGFKQDVSTVAEIVHRYGAKLYVDAYQSLGTEPLDVRDVPVDLLSSGNLKYLLGVPGSAYLYVRPELVSSLRPMATGWFGQEDPFAFDITRFQYADDGRRFDTGTPSVITAYAAQAGMSIVNEVGVENIKGWIDELSRFALNEVERWGMQTLSPKDVRCKGPITAVRVGNSHAVESELKKRNIIASARGPVIRLAPHFFSTREDIECALEVLDDILKGSHDGPRHRGSA